MRFLHKLILLLCTLIIVSSFIQFFAFDRLFLTNINSLLLATNEKAANNIGEQLFTQFKNTSDSLKKIASDPEIRKNQRFVDKTNEILSEVNLIFVFDKQGNMSLVSQPGKVSRFNVLHRDYFQHAIKGETYISGVYINAQGHESIAISTPVIENDSIVGVVVGTIWLHENKLAMMFGNKSFGRNGYIAIIDQRGFVIYHSDHQRIGKQDEIVDRLQGLTGSTIMKNYSGIEHYIGYSKIPDLGWHVIVGTPTAELAQLRRMMFYEILAVSILTILVVVVIGIYTVRRYMKPLEDLVEAFSSVKKGKYIKVSSYGYATEFDEMIQVYNDTIRKLEEVHIALQGAADIDGLTGAYNRRSFDKIVELMKGELRSGSLDTLGIMLLDLDNFKKKNDTCGHLAGDDILTEFTAIAQSVVGNRSIFRFGGDEFAILLRNIPDVTFISYAEEIRLQCARKLTDCTVSIGIATYPKNADSIEKLLEFADKALYISKDTKNKVTEYPTSN